MSIAKGDFAQDIDGRDALRFWRAHKAALLAIAASDGRGSKTEASLMPGRV